MKSKKAQEIINEDTGYMTEGGLITHVVDRETATWAVENAEAERDAKAIESHRSTCQYLFNDNPDVPLCDLTGDMIDCTGDCEFMKSFIQKLNAE